MAAERGGQNSGHAPPAGYGWADYLAALTEAHGTLTAVAWKLLEHASSTEDVASVERALRRLRTRGPRDGGAWGQRLVRVFGIPAAIEERLRWMGLYQSPFNDLPLALCLDQLRLWDRPPISTSRARLWLHLGHASCALRQRAFADAAAHVDRAAAAVAGLPPEYAAARVEIALIRAYLASHAGAPAEPQLDEAGELLAAADLPSAEAACFRARIIDQRAFQLHRRGDHAGALALYQSLPPGDDHPFASYRRDAGLAWSLFRTGRPDEALAYALRACDHAGDGGYTRLRAMGLLMLARIQGGPSADAARERARAIAQRLDDGELLARIARAQ